MPSSQQCLFRSRSSTFPAPSWMRCDSRLSDTLPDRAANVQMTCCAAMPCFLTEPLS